MKIKKHVRWDIPQQFHHHDHHQVSRQSHDIPSVHTHNGYLNDTCGDHNNNPHDHAGTRHHHKNDQQDLIVSIGEARPGEENKSPRRDKHHPGPTLSAAFVSPAAASTWASDDPVLVYFEERYGSRDENEALVDSGDELGPEEEVLLEEACQFTCYPDVFTGIEKPTALCF